MSQSIYDFTVNDIQGNPVSMDQYRGKALLIVNVASECGFTSQYAGLQSLYEQYKDRDFFVLGFPCNQFGGQEPGSAQEIQIFCQENYNVSFPLFDKIEVNGDGAHPLYQYLKSQQTGVLGSQSIKWNFTKFLVNREGQVLERYGSTTKPEAIAKDIEKIL